MLGRLLVLRQQQLDFQQGMQWNQLVHRKPGAVDWPNPNLDVAYSEAWLALDERSCAQISVPKIVDRYYTVQFLNGWGETLANINERSQPDHPFGEFAVCLKDAKVTLPAGVKRIDLRGWSWAPMPGKPSSCSSSSACVLPARQRFRRSPRR
ncbi:hypothetical protein D3C79_801890 [compost metagenome]